MKRDSVVILSISFILLISGCRKSSQSLAENNAQILVNEAKPKVTEIKTTGENALEYLKQEQAVRDFLAHKYPGWEFRLVSDDVAKCAEFSPCSLPIVSTGLRKKTVRIYLRKSSKSALGWEAGEVGSID